MDKLNDNISTLDRILRERLEQYNVPVEVRTELRKEISAFFQRPERDLYGSCVMTPEASASADRERLTKEFDPKAPKPQIL
jgi:hypothetical protein